MATGGQVLIEALRLAGVRHIWGLPGTQTLAVWDALLQQDVIKAYFLRNEADLSLAAKGYFQAGGGISAVVTVPGPGATNMLTGVIDALTDSAGMVLITTDVPKEHIGKGCVHESDLKSVFASAVKAQEIVDRPDQLADAVFKSVYGAGGGRPGPIQVIVSGQLLRADAGTALPTETDAARHRPTVRRAVSDADLNEAARQLTGAKRPLIYAGGGVAFAHAEAALQQLAERLGAAVVTSLAGRGVIPDDHKLSVGVPFFPSVNDLIGQSDAALVVGTRFSEFSTASWAFKLPATTIRVDVDESALELNYAPSFAVLGDAREFLEGLVARIPERRHAANGWSATIAETRAAQEKATDAMAAEAPLVKRIHPTQAIQALRAALPKDVAVTMDGSATEMWVMDPSFPVYTARGFICSEVFQELGAALPLAIGAKVAQPDRPVVCISGDGGMMYCVGELSAMVSQGIDVKIVVFDDGGWYNSIRQFQDAFFDGRVIGTFLGNPDFKQLSAAFGVSYRCAKKTDEVEPLVRQMLSEKGPGMLVVEIDKEPIAPRFKVRITERRKTL